MAEVRQTHQLRERQFIPLFTVFHTSQVVGLGISEPSTVPKQSMYGIFPYIYHKNQPNVGQCRYMNIPAPWMVSTVWSFLSINFPWVFHQQTNYTEVWNARSCLLTLMPCGTKPSCRSLMPLPMRTLGREFRGWTNFVRCGWNFLDLHLGDGPVVDGCVFLFWCFKSLL